MTFDEIQDELVGIRFGETRRSSVRRWINMRYQQVNSMTTWPWSYPMVEDVATSGGSVATTITAISQVYNLTDDWELAYLASEEARRLYLTTSPETGSPTHYTVEQNDQGEANRLLRVMPVGDVSLRITGKQRPTVLSASGDVPVWPTHWHYALVLGAMATGLKVENDPTWESLELEFNTMIQAMKDELLPAHQPSTTQYGRDLLGEEHWPWT